MELHLLLWQDYCLLGALELHTDDISMAAVFGYEDDVRLSRCVAFEMAVDAFELGGLVFSQSRYYYNTRVLLLEMSNDLVVQFPLSCGIIQLWIESALII